MRPRLRPSSWAPSLYYRPYYNSREMPILRALSRVPPMPVIGYFSGRAHDAEAPLRIPFLKALAASGFTDGRNVAIEYRFAEGQDERLPALAAELVRRPVTMLVATDRPSALAAKAATATLPI